MNRRVQALNSPARGVLSSAVKKTSITSGDGAARGAAAAAVDTARRRISGVETPVGDLGVDSRGRVCVWLVRGVARGVAPGAADRPRGTSRVARAVRPRAETAMCSSTRVVRVCIIDII